MSMNALPPQAYTKETLAQAYSWLRSQPLHVQELAKSPDILVSLYNKGKLHGSGYFERPNIQNFKKELKNLAGLMGVFEEDGSSLGTPQPPGVGAKAQESPTVLIPNEGLGQMHSFAGPTHPPRYQTQRVSQATLTSITQTESLSPQPFLDANEGHLNPSYLDQSGIQQKPGSFYQQGSPYYRNPEAQRESPELAKEGSASNYRAARDEFIGDDAYYSAPYKRKHNPSSYESGPRGTPDRAENLSSALDERSKQMIAEVKLQLNLNSSEETLRLLINLGYKKAKKLF